MSFKKTLLVGAIGAIGAITGMITGAIVWWAGAAWVAWAKNGVRPLPSDDVIDLVIYGAILGVVPGIMGSLWGNMFNGKMRALSVPFLAISFSFAFVGFLCMFFISNGYEGGGW